MLFVRNESLVMIMGTDYNRTYEREAKTCGYFRHCIRRVCGNKTLI